LFKPNGTLALFRLLVPRTVEIKQIRHVKNNLKRTKTKKFYTHDENKQWRTRLTLKRYCVKNYASIQNFKKCLKERRASFKEGQNGKVHFRLFSLDETQCK